MGERDWKVVSGLDFDGFTVWDATDNTLGAHFTSIEFASCMVGVLPKPSRYITLDSALDLELCPQIVESYMLRASRHDVQTLNLEPNSQKSQPAKRHVTVKHKPYEP